MVKEMTVDKLIVKKCDSRIEMASVAACDVSAIIKKLLAKKEEINMIFGAAPSQDEFLENIKNDKSIDFSRINVFHMDEYIGISPEVPQGFGKYLRDRLFDQVPFKSVNCLDCTAPDAEAEGERYSKLLMENPTDIVCLGIGENGHIAFNDPPVADFNDPKLVKIVELDPVCRQQQVNDGCFATLDEVPTHALTLTIPALIKATYAVCVVPAKTKAQAVHDTLCNADISERCPATVLRRHDNAVLYIEPDSASLLS